MAVVTLTSDMGWKDHYLGALKGSLVSLIPDATIIDISHDVPAFDIIQAAFVLKNSYFHYPKGTIHLIGVNAEAVELKPFSNQPGIAHLLIEYDGHYFVGADNGIFSLIFEKAPDRIFEITYQQKFDTFPMLNVFVPVAAHLTANRPWEEIGKSIPTYRESIQFNPVIEANRIRGMVIYIDSYGNAITNITLDLFKQVVKSNDFVINLPKPKYNITEISANYSDVPEGENLALFSSAGHLTIAINKGVESNGGGANKLLGLRLNDIVQVEF